MGQTHLENAESTAFTGNSAPQLQESGLGSLKLEDIRSLDTKTSTANLPGLELNQALADTKGPINNPELNRQALKDGPQQEVWAPEESLSLGPRSNVAESAINSPADNRNAIESDQNDVWAPEEALSLGPRTDSTINSPDDNRNAIQGHEHDVWAPEEELSLGPKPDDSTINSPGENRNAIEGHEKDVWAPEEELSLDRHAKQRAERQPISNEDAADDPRRVYGGDKDRPHWMWAPEEKLSPGRNH